MFRTVPTPGANSQFADFELKHPRIDGKESTPAMKAMCEILRAKHCGAKHCLDFGNPQQNC